MSRPKFRVLIVGPQIIIDPGTAGDLLPKGAKILFYPSNGGKDILNEDTTTWERRKEIDLEVKWKNPVPSRLNQPILIEKGSAHYTAWMIREKPRDFLYSIENKVPRKFNVRPLPADSSLRVVSGSSLDGIEWPDCGWMDEWGGKKKAESS
jgi:hypothetical protein